ncbi:hypothetical protein D3C72_245250 [compost metagenome]
MKKIYFDVRNGEVVDPSMYFPGYCAIVQFPLTIVEIKACFSLGNIEMNGDYWALKQVLKSQEEWTTYKWLLPSLWSFAMVNPFQKCEDFEETLKGRFEYIPFLEKELI